MKRIISTILAFIIIVSATVCFATESETAQSPVWHEYYVAKHGSDSNDGINKPFATIKRAVEEVRKVSPQMQGDIIVNIDEGTYTFDETLVMSPEDSGKNGYRVIYKGNNYPTLSGGFSVEGFKPSTRDERFWEAKVEDVEDVYGLYVNTKRAFVANSNYRISSKGIFDDPKTPEKNDGLYVSNQDICEYKQADRVELWYTTDWTFTKASVASISRDAASNDLYVVRMVQPEWNTYFASTTNYPDISDMFVISNAYELLDTPGEYYYDKELEKLYYYPREDEDMKTAEVIIPNIDTLIKIQGQGIENQVKNITFEGMRFAYTSNSTLETTRFYMSKQGTNIPDYSQNALHNIPTLLSTVEIHHTDGINFEKNIFLGCGVVGINMIHGVFNTKINANAFADIGDTAIAYGHVTHHDFALGRDGVGDAPNADAKMDVTTGSLISGSMPIENSALRYDWYYTPKWSYGAPLFITDEEFGYKKLNEYDRAPMTWTGDPNASTTGEVQWLKYDFREKYSVDKIMVAFNPTAVTKNQKSKYEVLLSNDKDFEDESTIVVAVQEEAPSDIVTYNVDSTEKYRYCMLRTIEPKDFAITRVAVLSPDVKPYTNFVRNVNCDITNNYITRTGQGNGVIGSGSSINAYGYDEAIRMVNNEFYNLPYSSTGIGYGWSDTMKGGRNSYIAYNYFHDLNKVFHDGGSLYLMSNQEGFVGERNYTENQTASYAAIYLDEGSSDQMWRENVTVDVPRTSMLARPDSIFRNNILTTYSTTSNFMNRSTDSIVEEPIIVRYGDLIPDAERIKQESGIADEYQYIKDLVPEFELYGFDERFTFFNPRHTKQAVRELTDTFVPEGISNVLGGGKFGILFGQYPEAVKERLTEYKDIVVSGAVSDYVKKADLNVGVREYLREYAKVRRLEADEMLEFCKTELDKAKETCIFDNAVQAAKASKVQKTKAVGTYTKADIAEFEKAILKAEVVNKEDKVYAAFDLEDAYNKFFRSMLGGGFEAANLKGMQSSDIDYDTHTVTFYVYPGDDLAGKTPELKLLSSKNYFGKVVDDKLDLIKGAKVPIYCDVLKTYTDWTIKAVVYKEESGTFISAFSDKEFKVAVADATLLMPSQTVYMKQEYADGKGELNFKPSVVNKSFKLTAVFGASVCSEFVRNSSDSRYARMELEMTESTVALYKVIGGAKKKICEMSSNINKNAYNTIKYVTNTHNEVCTLNVYINGKKMDEVIIPETCADGYMGIFTDKLPVYVK